MVQPVHVQHVQQVQPVQPIQHVQHVQQQPVQYVVKESQYRPPPQPQFVQTRSTGGDVNYVAAAPGRPVSTLRDSKLFVLELLSLLQLHTICHTCHNQNFVTNKQPEA